MHQADFLCLMKLHLHLSDQKLGVFLNDTLEFSSGFEPDAGIAEQNSVPCVRQVAELTGINGPFWS